MSLLKVSAYSPLECKQKQVLMDDMCSVHGSPMLNWRLTCSDNITLHVSAFDMACVSSYLKCSILEHESDGGSVLQFDAPTMSMLIRLAYTGAIRAALADVAKLFTCADYLNMVFCTEACTDAYMEHLDGCSLEDILLIHDFCCKFESQTARLLCRIVDTLATDFRIDTVADMLPPELLEQVVARDELRIASELVLARALSDARAWSCLKHVRIEKHRGRGTGTTDRRVQWESKVRQLSGMPHQGEQRAPQR